MILIAYLSNIINTVIRLLYFPRLWKLDTVIYIPKTGKPISISRLPCQTNPISPLKPIIPGQSEQGIFRGSTDRGCDPQGPFHSPISFNLFPTDSPIHFRVMAVLYRDDIAFINFDDVIVRLRVPLQSYLHSLQRWYVEWRLKINVSKLESIFISRRNRHLVELRVNDRKIAWKKTAN